MANESLHKGWLYARDGLKFAPYVLTESVVDRNGNTWANVVDGKVADLENAVSVINNTSLPNLQGEINSVEDRALALEYRTQYLNAEASDVFYITDSSGWVQFKVDGVGAHSTNFTTPTTDLNSLKQTTDDMGQVLAQIQNVSIGELRGLINELQERTRYMDASNVDNAFYFTDGEGNVIARVDGNGITSLNFYSDGVTDLNSLNDAVGELIQKDLDLAGLIAALTDRALALEERTKYMNASSPTGEFAITDGDGYIGFKVDNNGSTSNDFIVPGLTSLRQLNSDLDKETTDRAAADQALRETDDALAGAINANTAEIARVDGNLSPRVENLEIRTKFMDASTETGEFCITDKDGYIGFKVNNEGATSAEFIITDSDISKTIYVKDAIEALRVKDSDIEGSINELDTSLTSQINSAKSELTTLINTTKSNLQQEIDDTEASINTTITNLSNELKSADEDLGNAIVQTNKDLSDLNADLTPRVYNLESRTKYMDASTETGIFAITDKDGYIGMQVDNNGVLSSDFTIQVDATTQLSIKEKLSSLDDADSDLGQSITNLESSLTTKINTTKTELNNTISSVQSELNTQITNVNTTLDNKINTTKNNLTSAINDLAGEVASINTTLDNKINTTKSDLQTEITTTKNNLETLVSNTDTSIRADMAGLATELRNKDSEFTQAIGDLTPRMAAVETRTRFMDASTETGVFAITDKDGNIGMQVDNNGITANKFIIQTKGNVNTQIPVIGYQITGQIEI